MSSEDLIVTKIINRFDIGVETIDIATFLTIMKNVSTMTFLVNPKAGTKIDVIIQKSLENLEKESSKIPQEQLMADAIKEKDRWIQYAGRIETNFRDYVISQIRKILSNDVVLFE